MRNEFKQLCFDAEDYLADGQFTMAIKTYRTALLQSRDESEKFLALTYIGAAYDEEGNQRMAIATFKECRELAEKSFGSNSVQFAVSLSNEGMVYSNRRKSERAEPLLDAAVQILRSAKHKSGITSLPNAWDSIVDVFANAGECKARLGKINDALALMKEACALAKANLPSDNQRRVQASLELGALLACLGLTHDADEIMKDVMVGLQKSMKNPHAAFQMVQQTLANTASFLDGIQNAQLSPGSKSTAREHSNVIPIVPYQNAPESPDCEGYQLKILLSRVQPPVWRRVVVPAGCSLSKLHTIIQKAMGWTDSHLHEFRIGRLRFGDVRQPSDGVKDERKVALADLHLSAGSKIEYEYDFGDGWVHSIIVEKTLEQEELDASDIFVTGKRACPPEDCGGPYAFMNLLAALNEADKEKLPEWLAEYDPTVLPSCFKPKSKKKDTTKIRTKTPVVR